MAGEKKHFLTTRELVIFAMLGALMFTSKKLMEALPNIHLIGMFTVTCTVVFRKKGLIPIYVYVFLDGLFSGFGIWWIPYLYIWTILWGVTMLLPKNMPQKLQYIIYPAVCCLHGLLFGTLYAPVYAVFMHMNTKTLIAWIVQGLPYDAIHGASNLALGLLIMPLVQLIRKLMNTHQE